MQYKKGDKVLCLRGYDGTYKNEEYTITGFDPRGWLKLKKGRESIWWWHNPARFTMAKLTNAERMRKRRKELCIA